MQVEFIAGKGIIQTADAAAKSVTTAVDMSKITPEWYNSRDTLVITSSGDWVAPKDGILCVTLIGGGGAGGAPSNNADIGGPGGGAGGRTSGFSTTVSGGAGGGGSGGGGSSGNGGGGGAGETITRLHSVSKGNTFPLIIGAGGGVNAVISSTALGGNGQSIGHPVGGFTVSGGDGGLGAGAGRGASGSPGNGFPSGQGLLGGNRLTVFGGGGNGGTSSTSPTGGNNGAILIRYIALS